jgi:hypothetical protein
MCFLEEGIKMKKSMWIGMAGLRTPMAVGFDGEKLYVTTPDAKMKASIERMFERVKKREEKNKSFDFPDYFGTSSMYFIGETKPWNKEIFDASEALLKKKR